MNRPALVATALLVTACTSGSPRPHPAGTPSPAAPAIRPAGRLPILAWTPRRLAPGLAQRVAAVPGVRATVVVSGGTAWLTGSTDARGRPVDHPRAGTGIPLDVAAADPVAYGRLVPLPSSPRPGAVILGASAARLRRLGAGGALLFRGVRLRVAAVVPDAAVGYAEVFTTPADAIRLRVATPRYLLVDAAVAVGRRIARLPEVAGKARVRLPGQARWLRAADAVLPPVREKQVFGEYAATPPAADGSLGIDPRWRAAHIVTATVPVLGKVTCNRRLFAPLTAALRDLVSSGLGRLVDPAAYGGCFVPRVVRENASGEISHHTWGSAIDLNVSRNPFGGPPDQDPRLVAVMARHGFTWGGTWLIPDGMHFEYIGGGRPANRLGVS